MSKRFSELNAIADLASQYPEHASLETTVEFRSNKYPIYSFSLGEKSPEKPVICYVGGVHGLERIGTQILISYLSSFLELAKWDLTTQYFLSKCRVLFYPLVNPVGMVAGWRSNGNGVDIMRNAPIDATEPVTYMVGGHRISKHLPWFRGRGGELELETSTLCQFIRREVFGSPFSVILDIHSGFGTLDRIWFPFAGSRKIFPQSELIGKIAELLNRVHPYHIYRIEPQSLSYLTHGDVWDYLYLEHQKNSPEEARVFLPLTLELGSWIWVKKNPKQLLKVPGIFNPIIAHRKKRAHRRHVGLFEFINKITLSNQQWRRS